MPAEKLLKDLQVRNAQPGDKLLDGGGLYLICTPTGKFWRFRYRVRATGKPTELSLGSYPATDLKAARDRRDERRKEIEAGADPSKVRKETKRAAKVSASNTFGVVARDWLALRRKEWVDYHADLIESQLNRLLFPDLEHEPINDIKVPRMLEVLNKIQSACMQGKVRGTASQIFRYGVAAGLCEADPASVLSRALARHEQVNFPTIDPERLPKFLHDLDHYGENLPEHFSRTRLRVSQAATQMLMLTFLRSTELRFAQWSEIDFDKAIWTVPGERMKKVNRRKAGHGDHLVPLSQQALEILRELREIGQRVARGSPYVFPSQRDKKKPINKQVIGTVLRSIGYGGEMSNHGFRHLASTMLNEAHNDDGLPRFNADVIERQLGHISGGTRGVYNKAEYLPQRAKLMQAWADMLDDDRKRGDGGNVVPIGKRKAA